MYQIEEVAKKTNLTKRALRYYEELGLVSPSGRTESGYRLYTDEDVTHILHVKNTRDLLGASLQEIKEIMDLGKRYELLKQDYFSDKHANDQHVGEKLRLLTELEVTLRAQRDVLQEKLNKLTEMLQGYDEKLTRITNKKRELEKEIKE
ncbi:MULTISPECIES: MerR family transcriptional regulator [Brevibacillus]|jgi:DNA-binding transcriptional MerR regulator|uniref:MerR family transcriptional regulator n=1 Tax=Brevibacillus borstelensis AK1 TaxID=1300222 RepID=M8DEC7_9BACL|nr:MerR family transcriptional regulator [Brevibacillus borstelensis]EMT51833.1 MerR family transcriptional regulator [Brevibacillus borstelensis AK1]MCM3558248.1 MerR family transcriptional regulator [Brevibacillus borstelensis]MCM3621250.1 MerR family transcriptional regulator [Brevibacillus borstelensis]MED1872103.1 MerR family transcriptional regulator [Brevibacillus borstelensis]MED2008300.1 MerR family transcriptional regulator [Brevibacillus borstelensis]